MQVAEKFISINGEGTRAGELAVFIRFTGCNLTCSYCDTVWANEAGCPYEDMSPEDITAYIKTAGIANVTLTGGEPLLQKEMGSLLALLAESGCDEHASPRVEIETNGSVDIAPFCGKNRPFFTLDYKLPSSGCEEKMLTGNFSYLQADDTVKLVCGSETDLQRAYEVIREHELTGKCNIYLSPVFGRIDPAGMVEFMTEKKMNGVRLQLQLHKHIWHPEARGV